MCWNGHEGVFVIVLLAVVWCAMFLSFEMDQISSLNLLCSNQQLHTSLGLLKRGFTFSPQRLFIDFSVFFLLLFLHLLRRSSHVFVTGGGTCFYFEISQKVFVLFVLQRSFPVSKSLRSSYHYQPTRSQSSSIGKSLCSLWTGRLTSNCSCLHARSLPHHRDLNAVTTPNWKSLFRALMLTDTLSPAIKMLLTNPILATISIHYIIRRSFG